MRRTTTSPAARRPRRRGALWLAAALLGGAIYTVLAATAVNEAPPPSKSVTEPPNTGTAPLNTVTAPPHAVAEAAFGGSRSDAHAARVLRVCADPNNLPFSDRTGDGFENRIAGLLADELHARIAYTWWAQRRGFARNTVRADHCDFWVGVATGVETMATTAPYYRSSYVFVTRQDRHLDLHSLDDPRLRTLTLGVQMIGNDATNTPPAHALARRGITANVRGFMVYGNYAAAAPQAPIVQAVADGTLDAALVWGPLAGYFAAHSSLPLTLTPIQPQDDAGWPMAFDIGIGVRRADAALKAELEQALQRQHDAIARVLDAYGVPRVAAPRAVATR